MKLICERFLIPISAILFSIGTFVAFINVILRRVFNEPWAGTEELSSNLLMAIVFLPLAFVELKNKQLNIPVLFNILPSKWKLWCRKLQHLVILIIFLFLTTGAWKIVVRNFEEGNITLVMGIPVYVLYLIMLISFVLTVFTKTYQLFMSEENGDSHVD
jgi:C4-dicarboxylate transporter, DctQ subunit